MLDFIHGTIIELSPERLVLEQSGIGFALAISQQTFDTLSGKTEATIYTAMQIIERDGDIRLTGFADKMERQMYRFLKSVNGIGANMALNILSQLGPQALVEAVLREDDKCLNAIKGIGVKTAKRIILDLKDKLTLVDSIGVEAPAAGAGSTLSSDAILAMMSLGYNRNQAEKAVSAASAQLAEDSTLEELIRAALQNI